MYDAKIECYHSGLLEILFMSKPRAIRANNMKGAVWHDSEKNPLSNNLDGGQV